MIKWPKIKYTFGIYELILLHGGVCVPKILQILDHFAGTFHQAFILLFLKNDVDKVLINYKPKMRLTYLSCTMCDFHDFTEIFWGKI